MDKRELFALALIAAVALSLSFSSLGLGHLLTQESFGNALLAESAAKGEGGGGPLHQLEAELYERAAAYSGADRFDLETNETVLRFLPGLLAITAVVGTYFAVRGFYGMAESALSALLFASSIAFVSVYLSGVFVPASLGLALFTVGAAAYAQAVRRGRPELGLGGAVLFILSLISWNYSVLMLAALAVGALAQLVADELSGGRRTKLAYATAAALAPPLVSLAFIGVSVNGAPSTAPFIQSHLLLLPLLLFALLAAAGRLSGVFERMEWDAMVPAHLLASAAAGLLSPLTALPGFALSSAYAVEAVEGLAGRRRIALFVCGAAAFYAALVMMLSMMELTSALVLALLLGAAGAFVASMADRRELGGYATLSVTGVVLFASLFTAISAAHYQEDPVDPELGAATAWLAENGSGKVAAPFDPEMVAFLSQREVEGNTSVVREFLLTNGSVEQLRALGIKYVMIDYTAFDRLEEMKNSTGIGAVRMESFAFAGVASGERGTRYAAFVAPSGKRAFLPLTETDSFDLSADALLIDPYGGQRRVSAARFLFLRDSQGVIFRAVFPYENYDVNLFNAFFGKVNGLRQVFPEKDGMVRVFEVE